MAVFPNIPPTSYNETVEDSAIKDKLENGYVQTRRKYTRSRKIFNYEFKNISNADADTIMSFFDTVETFQAFQLALPQNRGTVTVRFTQPPRRVFVSPTTATISDVIFREI